MSIDKAPPKAPEGSTLKVDPPTVHIPTYGVSPGGGQDDTPAENIHK